MRLEKERLNIKEVITYSDERKKEIIDNRIKHGIDSYDLCDIISSMNDDKYKKHVIENAGEYDLRSRQIVDIVASINDDNYKDSIIRDRSMYNLSSYDILVITESMNLLAIKRILTNNRDYPLDNNDLVNIVRHIPNDSLKKDIVSNNAQYKFNFEQLANIISSIDDDDYKKFCINKFRVAGVESFSTSIVVQSVKDDKFKYDVICNYKEYGLLEDDILFIMESFVTNKYLFDFINNYKEYGFNLDYISEIVCLIRSDAYKAKTVYNNDFGFNSVQLVRIINSITDSEVKKNLMDILYKKDIFGSFDIKRELSIPDEMTFGVEIEVEGINNRIVRKGILPDGWVPTPDPTLRHGVEAVSPILKKGSEENISRVCSILNSLNLEATRNCGGHVHFGSAYFGQDVNSYKNLIEILSCIEGLLYLIANQEGDIPRKYAFKYSLPITSKIEEVINNDPSFFDKANSFNRFSRVIKSVQATRFSSVNFNNVGVPHKDTIEFRLANGTVNPNVWIDNVNLFGALMWLSKKISNIQKKAINMITDEDKFTLAFYERLKDETISDKEKMKVLFNMLPMLDERVYFNRYDINSKLYEEFDGSSVLEELSRLKPVRVSECNDELKEIIDNNYKEVFGNYDKKTNGKNVI